MPFEFPGSRPKVPIVPPPIPASKLPQTVAPTKLSRGLQIASFGLATVITGYAVLVHDFGEREHVFMPVRRFFDAHTSSFFTLSERDRAVLEAQKPRSQPQAAVQPSHQTPVEFFKENPILASGSQVEGEGAKKV
ncbi:hypothetical protein JCM11641_006910 [Rhodosporidiobolus odoratus]